MFSAINNYYYQEVVESYLSSQIQLYKSGYLVNPDLNFLDLKCSKDNSGQLMLNLDDSSNNDDLLNNDVNCSQHCLLISRNESIFNEIEDAATEIMYRCPKC